MFNENDKVITLVEKEGFPKGTVGIVVSKYLSANAYEVELWDETQYPIDVVTYTEKEISLVPKEK